MPAPSALDHPVVAARYFFPRSDAPSQTVSVAVDGASLACASHRPHADGPLLVHFHGNGETIADYIPDFVTSRRARGSSRTRRAATAT